MKKVAIIGAGLAGLSAAQRLQASGCEVVVLEKSRSLGGRCASRLWEGNVVDHGAQYFTMRVPSFSEEMHRLCGDSIQRIEAPITLELGSVLPERSPRYYHVKGNNHLGRALGEGLTIRKETTVEVLEAAGGKWLVAGDVYDAVLVTAPWPQAAKLLGTSIPMDTFAPCLTALFSYAMPWTGRSPEIYAHSWAGDDLAWSACENHKSGRIQPGQVVFVAQAGRSFSEIWLEADPAEWAATLRNALELRWGLDPAAFSGQFTHRWRYARSLGKIAQPDLPRGLYVSGDAFSDSRVESAWLAGAKVADRMLA
ncbi:MAG: FAD-dependent oxidoreductase [Chthoniobacterales bacterium]